uniref:Col_cuticle_N domain-containing protein n=1 Tax=Caenorhabditis tropicalis TaxID=1561998 RepID=A0A1I7UK44_9PELO
MASVVVVTAGAALAVSVPFVALKESLESRFKSNMKKHLGQRHRCRVKFPDVEDELEQQYALASAKKNNEKKVVSTSGKCSSDDEDNSSTISSPPSYNDITQPPACKRLVRATWQLRNEKVGVASCAAASVVSTTSGASFLLCFFFS